MATVRVSPTEVQVNQVIYVYAGATQADAFEACVAVVEVGHCALEHPPLNTRQAVDGA